MRVWPICPMPLLGLFHGSPGPQLDSVSSFKFLPGQPDRSLDDSYVSVWGINDKSAFVEYLQCQVLHNDLLG